MAAMISAPFAKFYLLGLFPLLKAQTNNIIIPTNGILVIKIVIAQSFTDITGAF
jgi:hypothetical protein